MKFSLLKSVAFVAGRRYLSAANFKPVTHCIFDMDGLLLDTEVVYKKMITMICEEHNKQYTDEVMLKILGGTEQRLAEIVCRELRLPITPAEFREKLLQLGDTMLANAPLMDGAARLLRHLHASGVPMALATSSSDRSVETKVQNHRELFDLFQHKVMGSTDPDVKHGKPHPDIFLVAAARFKDAPAPDKCLVFEDSPHGVTAAVDAGMQSVMVPDPHTDRKLTTHATVVLPTLAAFRPEAFGLPAFKS